MSGARAKGKPKSNNKHPRELQDLWKRLKKLEKAVEEKDREIREISIHRSEVIEEFELIRETLSKLATTQEFIERLSRARSLQESGGANGMKVKNGVEIGFSYRDRMILLNRIDIYRLFLTIIIVSSELRYPRKLNHKEESELQDFIKDLDKFENLILNMTIDEDIIWKTGQDCEKRILYIFNKFFSLK